MWLRWKTVLLYSDPSDPSDVTQLWNASYYVMLHPIHQIFFSIRYDPCIPCGSLCLDPSDPPVVPDVYNAFHCLYSCDPPDVTRCQLLLFKCQSRWMNEMDDVLWDTSVVSGSTWRSIWCCNLQAFPIHQVRWCVNIDLSVTDCCLDAYYTVMTTVVSSNESWTDSVSNTGVTWSRSYCCSSSRRRHPRSPVLGWLIPSIVVVGVVIRAPL